MANSYLKKSYVYLPPKQSLLTLQVAMLTFKILNLEINEEEEPANYLVTNEPIAFGEK